MLPAQLHYVYTLHFQALWSSGAENYNIKPMSSKETEDLEEFF